MAFIQIAKAVLLVLGLTSKLLNLGYLISYFDSSGAAGFYLFLVIYEFLFYLVLLIVFSANFANKNHREAALLGCLPLSLGWYLYLFPLVGHTSKYLYYKKFLTLVTYNLGTFVHHLPTMILQVFLNNSNGWTGFGSFVFSFNLIVTVAFLVVQAIDLVKELPLDCFLENLLHNFVNFCKLMNLFYIVEYYDGTAASIFFVFFEVVAFLLYGLFGLYYKKFWYILTFQYIFDLEVYRLTLDYPAEEIQSRMFYFANLIYYFPVFFVVVGLNTEWGWPGFASFMFVANLVCLLVVWVGTVYVLYYNEMISKLVFAQEYFSFKGKRDLWSVLKYLGILLSIADEVTDVVYYNSSEFGNTHLKRSCLAFLIILPCFYMVLSVYQAMLLRENKRLALLIGSPLIAFLWETKLIGIFHLFIVSDQQTSNFIWYFFMISENLLETIPQVIIQGINNSKIEIWSNFVSVTSFIVSICTILKDWYSLVYHKAEGKVLAPIAVSPSTPEPSV